jgi:hypothetical protein
MHHYLEPKPEKTIAVATVRHTAEVQHADTPGNSAAVHPSASVNTVKQDTIKQLPPPDYYEIGSWPGKQFVVLEKPTIYCTYGYELYTCPEIDSCRGGSVDTLLISKYHRARCDRFAGNRLKALAVTAHGSEWIVSFEDAKSGMTLYARTTKGILGELALEDDLDGAKKRFLGKIVFSARGFITAFTKGGASVTKVKLQDSLRVYDVRFGLTPLPTKPIWLMVESHQGNKGAIPVFYSWTNVKKELRGQGNPWDDDVFETSPERLYTIDAATWDIINSHTVRAGMTRNEVRLSWGAPLSTKTETLDGKERECWVYRAQRLYFDEKELLVTKDNRQ